jgi:hypothetical protein
LGNSIIEIVHKLKNKKMAKINFGGVVEDIVTREEFP